MSETGATASVIYVPPPFAAKAILEGIDAGLDLVTLSAIMNFWIRDTLNEAVTDVFWPASIRQIFNFPKKFVMLINSCISSSLVGVCELSGCLAARAP